MPALHEDQTRFARALSIGPSGCPFDLFEGGRERIARGFAVHANTISHARLVALEETFPYCRDFLGDARFNALSREFIEIAGAQRAALMQIGCGFAAWLRDRRCDPRAIDIATFEWLWLESHHAAEAPALELAALGDSATALLAVPARHPAARLLRPAIEIAPLIELDDVRFAARAPILIARPDAEVLAHPLTAPQAALFKAVDGARTLGEALEAMLADHPEADPAGAAIALIRAGGLVRKSEGGNR